MNTINMIKNTSTEHLQEAVLLEINMSRTTIRCDWLSSALHILCRYNYRDIAIITSLLLLL